MLDDLKISLDALNQPYPKVFYTDDWKKDKAFISRKFPSTLEVGVVNAAPNSVLPLYELKCERPYYIIHAAGVPEEVNAIYTALGIDPDDPPSDSWGDSLTTEHVISLDFEWPVALPAVGQAASQGHIALVQIAVKEANAVWNFHLAQMSLKAFPTSLKAFLERSDILKVGRGIGGDAKRLSHDWNVNIDANTLLDIGSFCYERGLSRRANASLDELAQRVLNTFLPKEHHIRVSLVWGATDSPLPSENLMYASHDAACALDIFLKAREKPKSPRFETLDQRPDLLAVPNLRVQIMVKSALGITPVAEGVIAVVGKKYGRHSHAPKWVEDAEWTVTGSQAVVTVDKVLTPDASVTYKLKNPE